jgi:hypothetical protein
MTAVCETEFFRERIEANPANRKRLLAMSAEQFIDVMTRWRAFFLESAELPVIGSNRSRPQFDRSSGVCCSRQRQDARARHG